LFCLFVCFVHDSFCCKWEAYNSRKLNRTFISTHIHLLFSVPDNFLLSTCGSQRPDRHPPHVTPPTNLRNQFFTEKSTEWLSSAISKSGPSCYLLYVRVCDLKLFYLKKLCKIKLIGGMV
jgi:hypothetical protein